MGIFASAVTEEQLGPLTGKQRQLIALLELLQIEAMVGCWRGGVGRPARHERAIARAFAAKAVYNLSHTRQLLERLQNDPCLRRICGWEICVTTNAPRWSG